MLINNVGFGGFGDRIVNSDHKVFGFELKRGHDKIPRVQSVLIVDEVVVNTVFWLRPT